MLKSTQPCVKEKDRPVFAVWLGNFYEPYYSDEEACRKAIQDVEELGLNSVILDSKVWSDFTRYFQTAEASPYVRMQLRLREFCEQHGVGISFLALFAIGDNLYPHIYKNPPEFVQQPIDLQGRPFRGYRHWSEQQLEAHVRHCLDLYQYIARGEAAVAEDEQGRERWPFYFYHSPVFAPSFDEDGCQVYLEWLGGRYRAEELAERYGIEVGEIAKLDPSQYWVYPERGADNAIAFRDVPEPEDYVSRPEIIRKYADNMAFKYEVMDRYFRLLIRSIKEKEPRFYLYSALTQWKYLFTEASLTDSGKRALDLWRMGHSLDSPSITTMPVDVFGEPDAYVVSCEMAMSRSAAGGKDFVGGLFMGRKPNVDVYSMFSPAEVVATAFGAGASDLYFYGYSGLDDGGNMGKWADHIKQSFKEGLDWFTEVRRSAGKRLRDKKAAILFPYATFTLGVNLANFAAYRHDVLGWYRQLADAGMNADILHPEQVKQGELNGYSLVVMPADPLYGYMTDTDWEKSVEDYVSKGGILLASASGGFSGMFGIEETGHKADSLVWEERIVVHSPSFKTFSGQFEELAVYLEDSSPALVYKTIGLGRVYRFGIDYGYSYMEKQQMTVPFRYGNDNQYPLPVLKSTPVESILTTLGFMTRRHRGVERIEFENGTLYLNHTPYVFHPEEAAHTGAISTFAGGWNEVVLPHQAAFFTSRRETLLK